MCGIAGTLARGPSALRGDRTAPAARSQALEQAIAALGHRGPDETGRYLDDDVALGHTRLAIVDLIGGQQPMPNGDGAIWVVFNGEIYNHIELREELRGRGHAFVGRSDTEVISHAYEEWGLDFPQHFNGQFAIGLWDKRRRRLVLVRDRMGVRPLFYAQTATALAFASETKALGALQAPAGRPALDAHALAQIFTLWTPLGDRTPFVGVHSVPPGHLLVADDDKIDVRRYWDWRLAQHPDSYDLPDVDAAIEELRALMTDAVRLRLRSDVPVGAYLSGGLDSSIITALVKTKTDNPLRTFSVTFADTEYDERSHQEALVRHLDADHSTINCSRLDIGQAFPRTIWHTECPILRTAPTPLLLLSGLVRRAGYKVVLTGEGADEVFGGYDLFKEGQIRRFWARRPNSKMRPALLRRLYPYLGTSPTASAAYAESFFRKGIEAPDDVCFAHLPRWATTQRAMAFFSADLRASLKDVDPVADVRRDLPRDFATWPGLARDQYIEAKTLLAGYLLSSQGDRVGMANSVEGRFPFLDHRVLALSARLSPSLKMLGLNEKFLLKRAFADILPASIVRRTKQPYRAPDSSSFFVGEQPLDYVAALLSPDQIRQAGYFDADLVTRLLDKCKRGRATGAVDNMAFVGVVSTMLLHEMFVNQTSHEDIAAQATPRRAA